MNERQGFSVAGIPTIVVCLLLALVGVALLLGVAGQPGRDVLPGIGLELYLQ